MCAADKKDTSETKKSGSCAQSLGCLIMIGAIIAVIIIFIVIPKINNSEDSFAGIGNYFSDLKDRLFNKVEDVEDATDNVRDRIDEVRDDAENALENTRDAANDSLDNAGEKVDSMVKAPPKLIRDDDKDSLEKANIKIYE